MILHIIMMIGVINRSDIRHMFFSPTKIRIALKCDNYWGSFLGGSCQRGCWPGGIFVWGVLSLRDYGLERSLQGDLARGILPGLIMP